MRRTTIAASLAQALALESVDFQATTFFKELTAAYAEMKGKSQKDIEESDIAARLGIIITHHTNLNVTINLGLQDPSVEIPMVNKNNVLINSFIRNYLNSSDGLKMIGAADSVVRGSVNMKTGKVTGVFSEVASTIHMPVYMVISPKFVAEEMAAITLHEVGHLFTYYEFMARSVTTNQVLAGMAKALDGSGTVEEREMVLLGVKKALHLTDFDHKILAKSTDVKVAEIVVITNVSQNSVSELGSNVYDFSTWEYLADQYATRNGSGRYLVTALDKLYKGSWNISFRSLPSFLAMEAFKATLLIGAFLVPGPMTGGLLNLGIMLVGMDGSGDGTYDRPGARFKRVRNQIIENLKDRKLSRDDHDRLQADLVAIDNVMTHVEDRRQLLGLIWDFVSPSSRRAWNTTRLQKELEDIAANDLFAKAAELRVHA